MSRGHHGIESPKYGGAIITAEIANGYNREVMAVPGSVSQIYQKDAMN